MTGLTVFLILYAVHEAACYNAQRSSFQVARRLSSGQKILHSAPVSHSAGPRRPQSYYFQSGVNYAKAMPLNRNQKTWHNRRTNNVAVIRQSRRDPRLKTSSVVNRFRPRAPGIPVVKPTLRVHQQNVFSQNRKPWVRPRQTVHRLPNGRYLVQKGHHSKQYFSKDYNLQGRHQRVEQQKHVLMVNRMGKKQQQLNQVRHVNKLPFDLLTHRKQRLLLLQQRERQRQQMARRLGLLQPAESKDHDRDTTDTPLSETTVTEPTTTITTTRPDTFAHQNRNQSGMNDIIYNKHMDKLHLASMLRIELNVLSKYDPEMKPGLLVSGIIETVKYVRGPQHGVIKSSWAYRKDVEHIGPEEWSRIYPTCKGTRQSPVNIRDDDVMYTSELGPFKFKGFDGSQSVFKMHNNGHTASITVSDHMKVEGGGLEGEYATANIHFHWSRDHVGSEHAVNGIKFPLEMHIVNYATRYGNLTNAMRYRDGLAVFAVFFTVRRTYNPYFRPIEEGLRRCRLPGSSAELDKINVEALIPRADSQYYRYYGSLTTPPCHQSVIWTLFDDIQVLSESQMGTLQNLVESYSDQPHMFPSNHSSSAHLKQHSPATGGRVTHFITDNYRSLQLSNNRAILTNIDHYKGKPAPPKPFRPASMFHPNISDTGQSAVNSINDHQFDSPVPKHPVSEHVENHPSNHYIIYL